MVSLLIVLVLFIGAYAGYKRGIIFQLLMTIGYALSFLFAMENYRALSDFLFLLVPYSTPFAPEANPYPFYDERLMFSLTDSYYDLLAFILLLFLGWVVVRFLAALLSYTLKYFQAPEPLSGIGGAVISFFVHYFGLFYILFFLTVLPFAPLQTRLVESSFASSILTATPRLSESTYQQFILDVYEQSLEEDPVADEVPVEEIEQQLEDPEPETTEEQEPAADENAE